MTERLTLPVLPLREVVLFPGVTAPIGAGRPATLRAIEAALATPDFALDRVGIAQRLGEARRERLIDRVGHEQGRPWKQGESGGEFRSALGPPNMADNLYPAPASGN